MMNTNMTNANVCTNCGCTDEQMFRAVVNGEECMLCQDCIDRLGLELCDECGVYHTPYVDMSRPDGITWVCDECLDTAWTQCACCGDYVRIDDAVTDEDGEYVCDWCRSEYYHECSECGRVSRYCHWDDDTEDYLCPDCYDDMRQYFHDYGYKPEAEFHSVETDDENSLYFGVESELDSYGGRMYHVSKALVQTGAPVYCKHDGSLSSFGVEMVTHPCTVGYHANGMGWSNLYSAAEQYGYEAHSCCGLHVHVGREQMGRDKGERRLTAGNCVLVVNAIWNTLVDFTRRDLEDLNEWAERPTVYRDTDVDDLLFAALATEDNGRYQAVNLTNYRTVEFRMFAGSDDAITTIASIQLCNNIVKYAMTHTPEECFNVDWSTIRDFEEFAELREYCARYYL